MKKYFLIIFTVFFFTIFSGCENKYDLSGLYFNEFYTSPKKMGELNIYIKEDSLFKNRNNLNALNNQLEYTILTESELNSLAEILNSITKKPLELYYERRLTEYSFIWGASFYKNDYNYLLNVMDTVNPKRLNELYLFVIDKTKSLGRFKKIGNQKKYEKIKIQDIYDLSNKSKLEFSSKIKESEIQYLIWHNLVVSKPEDYYKIENISDFYFGVDFSYLLNATDQNIEKIFISKSNRLAIKFQNSTDYMCINLTNFPDEWW